MLTLYVEAPFATFRQFTAGWYRPSALFLTPTAAYGLLLNFAGIESRIREESHAHTSKVPTSLTRMDLPKCRIAIGAATGRWDSATRSVLAAVDGYEPFPRVQTIFQQLHNYPVGSSGGDRASTAFGNKYNITPIRRELLSDLRAVIAIDGNMELERDIRSGIRGDLPSERYGIPYMGDNSFMIDRVEELETTPSAHWYERLSSDHIGNINRSSRMTLAIDRADSSMTKTDLFAPIQVPTMNIPDDAWVNQGAISVQS
jgi:CRISPR-associated protein Cas5t